MKNPLIDLFYQAEDYFFRSISKECLDFDELTTAYLTGVGFESDNLIYIRKNITSIDDVLNRSKIFYDINHSPWTVVVAEQVISNEITHSLNNIGFRPTGKSVAMFVELQEQTKYDIENNITMQSVDHKLEEWMMPLVGAFETTIEVGHQYSEAHKRALKNNADLHHFTLYQERMPTSSLTISMHNNIARITDVGTLPAYKGRGYATQLMKHAINEAINLGASYCFLEASTSGISVYQKLGFNSLFKNIYFHKRAN